VLYENGFGFGCVDAADYDECDREVSLYRFNQIGLNPTFERGLI
jgi:hypothetical protein